MNIIDKDGQTSLFKVSSLEEVCTLIKNGTNVNHLSFLEENALFTIDNVPILKYLVFSGINIFQKNYQKKSPLSVRDRPYKTIEYLLSLGISSSDSLLIKRNFETIKLFLKYNHKITSTEFLLYLNEPEIISLFIDFGFNFATTIHCSNFLKSIKSLDTLEYLIKLGFKQYINELDFFGRHLMLQSRCFRYYSSQPTHFDISILLKMIELGLDLKYTYEKKNFLFLSQSAEVASILINSGMDINILNEEGQNVLFYLQNSKKAKYLINKVPLIIDKKGKNPLLYTTCPKVFEILIKKHPKLLNQKLSKTLNNKFNKILLKFGYNYPLFSNDEDNYIELYEWGLLPNFLRKEISYQLKSPLPSLDNIIKNCLYEEFALYCSFFPEETKSVYFKCNNRCRYLCFYYKIYPSVLLEIENFNYYHEFIVDKLWKVQFICRLKDYYQNNCISYYRKNLYKSTRILMDNYLSNYLLKELYYHPKTQSNLLFRGNVFSRDEEYEFYIKLRCYTYFLVIKNLSFNDIVKTLDLNLLSLIINKNKDNYINSSNLSREEINLILHKINSVQKLWNFLFKK